MCLWYISQIDIARVSQDLKQAAGVTYSAFPIARFRWTSWRFCKA